MYARPPQPASLDEVFGSLGGASESKEQSKQADSVSNRSLRSNEAKHDPMLKPIDVEFLRPVEGAMGELTSYSVRGSSPEKAAKQDETSAMDNIRSLLTKLQDRVDDIESKRTMLAIGTLVGVFLISSGFFIFVFARTS